MVKLFALTNSTGPIGLRAWLFLDFGGASRHGKSIPVRIELLKKLP